MWWREIKNAFHLIEAIVAVILYRYPARNLIVIGVTGTDGKTTTTTLIYEMLRRANKKVALISTVAAFVGKEKIDTGFHVTSPNPWQLQKLLRKIVDKGYQYVVLEATSHGLDQHRMWGTNVTYGVLTNITHEHLDYHKSYDKYLLAKAKLFSKVKVAVLNSYDKSFERMMELMPWGVEVVKYSKDLNDNHESWPLDDQEISMVKRAIVERFSEKYNQANAIAAALVSAKVGVNADQIVEALLGFEGVVGRMQLIENHLGITVIVDFAHTPNALKEALIAVRLKTKGKIIVVFGAAGERDGSKRPLMGIVASENADEVILTSEDPRKESPIKICQELLSQVKVNIGHMHMIIDRREAIRGAFRLAKPGDLVLVCGKGHERSMNLDGKMETPWSDELVIREELGK